MEAKYAESKGEGKDEGAYMWDKLSEGDKGVESDPVDLALEELDVGPSGVPVSDPLELEMLYTIARPLCGAFWRVKYTVDTVHARHVIELGETPAEDLSIGANSMHFRVGRVSVEGLETGELTNAGILAAELVDGGGAELAAVNMVVQVHRRGEELIRNIYSPLE
mmetsp:Transcript_14910/g.44964  ORF Transcript_14910/g.44964 Transcript_14910/m.44964 type:complete len:165 (-) Transcript_14910:429-923(-)